MRAWLEIDLEKIKWNVNSLRSISRFSGCEIMAVLKADAYGHGAVPIGKMLNTIGVYSFSVATVDRGDSIKKTWNKRRNFNSRLYGFSENERSSPLQFKTDRCR